MTKRQWAVYLAFRAALARSVRIETEDEPELASIRVRGRDERFPGVGFFVRIGYETLQAADWAASEVARLHDGLYAPEYVQISFTANPIDVQGAA